MTALLLMSVAAAIGVGYLSAVAEVAVRKLHEVPVVRRTVEALFLFSLVDSVMQWTESQNADTVRGWFSRWFPDWSQIRGWLIIASVVAATAIAIALWLYFAALGFVIKLLLWLVVVVVLAGLWFASRR